jgi:hypothetical protein
MKKYFLAASAAFAIGVTFTSCSHDDIYDPATAKQSVVETYEKAFVEAFGQPAVDQDWGFGAATSAARNMTTRTITVKAGDAYDKFPSAADVAANFPTAIPADADEVSELETKYKGTTVQTQYGETTVWDIYAIYQHKIVEGYNLKITQAGTTELGGNYQNASYDGERQMELAHPYNVYVNVDGDVTIKRVGATHFNLYILKGNVTLESDYGEQAGIISVAAGATLNDGRNSIAANQGIKLFNKGTVNATNTEKYDIGNFSTVYNEGKFNVSGPLTYSPGDANDSYFMNLGDGAELTAPAMTLNSTGNFFNSGKVTISGETLVTQARLYWVNDGFYKTGTMTFSAKNTTFFNYCQLIVVGNAHMFDGEFNLMQNSYTEAGTAELDNFIVNMGSNTGINIKGDVRMVAQGDATYQGFRTEGSNSYVLIGGKVTVDAHYHTFSVSTGITYSVNAIEIVKGTEVVTDEYLKSINDGAYPVLDLSNGTECPYGKLTVTPNTNSCGATWKKDDDTPTADIRVIAEDLTITNGPGNTDFDFNDVVFDVTWVTDDEAIITLQAAGGTLPLTVGLANPTDDNYLDYEVHEKFGVAVTVMVNTKWHNTPNIAPVSFTVKGSFGRDARNIPVYVKKSGEWIELKAEKGVPASKIGVSPTFVWCDERMAIDRVYPAFKDWVQDGKPLVWWE